MARTSLGRARRVAIAGHLDTVPVASNLPTRREGDVLHGRGTCDMKGGVAVALRLAATVAEPADEVALTLVADLPVLYWKETGKANVYDTAGLPKACW